MEDEEISEEETKKFQEMLMKLFTKNNNFSNLESMFEGNEVLFSECHMKTIILSVEEHSEDEEVVITYDTSLLFDKNLVMELKRHKDFKERKFKIIKTNFFEISSDYKISYKEIDT